MTTRTWLPSLALALVLVLVAAPNSFAAGKPWEISLTGGLGLPQGDFKDEDLMDGRSGPQMGIDICYHITDVIALGADASWNRNKHGAEGETEDLGGGITVTAEKDRFTTIQFGLHGKYMFATSGKLKPYGLLGLGMYNIKEDWEYLYDDNGTVTTFTDESEDFDQPGAKFGWKLGAGATYMTSPKIGLGLGVDYNSFSLDEDTFGVSSVPYISVRGRLTYHIMPQ